MVLGVTGRQNVFDSSEMISSASSRVTPFSSMLMRGRVIGIEEDIDSGQLTDRAVDYVGLGGEHLDGDRDVGDGRQLDRTASFLDAALKSARWCRQPAAADSFWSLIIFSVRVSSCLAMNRGWIDRQGLLEFGHGFVEFAVIAQF